MENLTELQKTQIVYQYFTLEEWQLLVRCISHARADLYGTRQAIDEEKVHAMLVKFPSAVL